MARDLNSPDPGPDEEPNREMIRAILVIDYVILIVKINGTWLEVMI